MIITLTGATATKHLGGLNFYSIIVNKSSGVTVTLDKTTVSKDTAASETVTGTVTVADGYTLSSLVIKMGDTDKTSAWYNSSTGAITISGITANVTITAIAASNSGSGDSGDSGSGDSGETIYSSGTLPLVQNALSVVSGENFYQVSATNNTRMSSSSITDATGILVPAGYAITLTGTSGLRFDYVYATKAGPNSNDKTVNAIGGVGTASNFVNSNYFPLNADGSSNTITITNTYGADYYFFFAIAAPNKNSAISVSNYQGKITWVVKSVS